MADQLTQRFALLNDQFRQHRQGHGKLMITQGITAEGPDFVTKALQVIAAFDDFTSDNDPHGEHDFGSIELEGRKVFWKFDYYTPDLQGGSEDPSDETKTCRVLTVMFSHEY